MRKTETLQEHLNEFRKQLEKGVIQQAYRGLIDYIMDLRTHLRKNCPDYYTSGIYQGYMDMTYFSFTSKALQERRLKAAIVFVYDTFRFEVWLAGYNKSVQDKYWELIKETGWDKYRLVATTKGADSIIEHILVDNPDFSDLDALTKQIESETLRFIGDVEGFLYKQDN